MSDKPNFAVIIYVIVSLGSIITLGIFLSKCRDKTCSAYRAVCQCDRARTMMCGDRDKMEKSYLEGNNESKNFAKLQRKAGGPRWHSSEAQDE